MKSTWVCIESGCDWSGGYGPHLVHHRETDHPVSSQPIQPPKAAAS